MLGLFPRTWANVITLMSGFSANTRSTASISKFNVSISISTNTGVNPTCSVGFKVVGNPAIGIKTFVPLGRL